MKGSINMRPDQLFEPAVSAVTRGHEMKLRKPQAAPRLRRNALAVRAINNWNALPPSIILSASLQFKSCLDKHWGAVSFDIPDQDQWMSIVLELDEIGTLQAQWPLKSCIR